MALPKKVFLDTNIIMDTPDIYEDYEMCLMSIVTLEEIDKLKQSTNEERAFKAREASRCLLQADNVEIIIEYNDNIKLDLNINDNKILACAKQEFDKDNEIVLLTNDINVYFKAKALQLNVELHNQVNKDEIYKGFKEVILTENELADFYQDMDNKWDLLENEYLIIKDLHNNVVDRLRWSSKGFVPISKRGLKSIMFGDTKPRDVYQELAIDSLNNTEFTILTGSAGSAKTLLSLAFIIQQLQSGKIATCNIVYVPAPLKNTKEIGFLPGTKNEKILNSSLGGILSSKLGDMTVVESLIAQGKIYLIPASSIRGFESSENSCLYVTEAQNTDIYTLKTIIQRGAGCKIILEGDIEEQTDFSSCSGSRNGLLRAINVFKGEKEFSMVNLQNNYRSRVSNIAEKM